MKMKALVAVKTKLFKPCKKLFQIFKFKLRKPVFIRALRSRSLHNKARKAPSKNRMAAFLSGFRSLKQSQKRDCLRHTSLGELRSNTIASGATTDAHDNERMQLFPSPLTPAYVKAACRSIPSGNEEVEDACRSFENYLVEMIVEEGKVGDLTDVEELLYCWKNLKSPVFIDLVCRFYGELCKDLFSPEDDYIDDGPQ